MMLPRISIVTLSFNQASFLAAAMESILSQGYPELEYIVVDPGSRDDSRAIIERYRDRIDRLLLDPDQGPADGLNKGFATATGAIFGYINADDLMLPGSLHRIAAHFADPVVDAILGQGCIVDRDGRAIRRAGSSRFDLVDFGHGAMTFLQQGHYFRRSAFERTAGFNIENRTCWDAELLVDMALAGVRPVNVPDSLGAFRSYAETISGNDRLAAQRTRDLARIKARALGRGPRASDRIVAPLRLMMRRLGDPAMTLAGLRARWHG